MDIVLTYPTSLEFWRLVRAKRNPSAMPRPDSGALRLSQLSKDEAKLLAAGGLGIPVHCLSPSVGQRKRATYYVTHSFSSTSRKGMFCSVDDGFRVCSPELCLLRAASLVSFERLLLLCYEFCGSYIPGMPSGKLNDYPALTSASKLQAFARKYSSFRGSRQLLRASSYVLDGSGSPMESKMVMLLTLPTVYGGYGLPRPKMNEALIIGGREMKPDLYWADARVGVEYDSDQEHTGSSRIAHDARRRNRFIFADYCSVTVTREQIGSIREMDEAAAGISRLIGYRLRIRRTNFRKLQIRLRRELGLSI